MDTQRSSLLTWAYYCQGKSMEDLRHSLLLTSLELEQTRQAVQEELRKRDDQLSHVKDLLSKTMRERDEAQDKFQRLLLEKLLLQQQQQQQQQNDPLSGISSIEDEQQPKRGMDSNNGFSSSDCEESIVSSPVTDQNPLQFPPPQPPSMAEEVMEMVPEKPLPEKGKLLQAVMKAGPLLQTLLLAGPLPQWRHPPPSLESYEIPPVTIPSPPPSLSLPPPQLLHQDTLIINSQEQRYIAVMLEMVCACGNWNGRLRKRQDLGCLVHTARSSEIKNFTKDDLTRAVQKMRKRQHIHIKPKLLFMFDGS